MSEIATSDKLARLLGRIEPQKAAQVVKMRSTMISELYAQATTLADTKLSKIASQAQASFTTYYDKEIKRLTQLALINPNIRDTEIEALEALQEKGQQALANLSLNADSVRVLITIKND